MSTKMPQPVPASNDRSQTGRRNLRLGLKLGALAVFMVCFTTVLWWTAGILCDWAGIGLNPNSQPRTEIRMQIVEPPVEMGRP
ncbi:MAG: hypothetical protein EA401_13355 [Planctomycetota bacterium]|nr:MAG: hypothetical protein EA401_13355 [Planctomycetota bacterium]